MRIEKEQLHNILIKLKPVSLRDDLLVENFLGQLIFSKEGITVFNDQTYIFYPIETDLNCIISYTRLVNFITKTKEDVHKEDLKDLRNAQGDTGSKPIIYDVSKDSIYATACEIAKGFSGKTAIIARTNYQIMDISRELTARGIEFSSTFFLKSFSFGVSSNQNSKEPWVKKKPGYGQE